MGRGKSKGISLNAFKNYYLKHNYDENMFKENGSINPEYNSSKVTGLIAQILEEHANDVLLKYKDFFDKYRENARQEIDKVIACYNKNLGCTVYQCPKCHDYVFIGNTCKSRLCSSCGYKYKNQRVEKILETAYKCNHRQIVFTIPKELRKYFLYDYTKLSILFTAVNETLYSIFNETYKYDKKKKKLKKFISKIVKTPGFFAFLHTFGRDLKWNPHIHVLIAELELCSNDKIKKHEYFDFNALSKRFQKILLDLMEKEFGNEFKKEKIKSYKNHKNGFYVYAEKKKFKSLKDGVEYVTRYCGRAPISENRILNYDGENVTYCYNAHEDGKYHEVTISAEKFIILLIMHLIPKNFKIIRYYGFYRKKHKLHNQMIMLIKEAIIDIKRSLTKYKLSILKSFNRDPYNCPKCDVKMNYIALIE